MLYVLIELLHGESCPVNLQVFAKRADALTYFKACVKENEATKANKNDATEGTIAFAHTDDYSVSVIERRVES